MLIEPPGAPAAGKGPQVPSCMVGDGEADEEDDEEEEEDDEDDKDEEKDEDSDDEEAGDDDEAEKDNEVDVVAVAGVPLLILIGADDVEPAIERPPFGLDVGGESADEDEELTDEPVSFASWLEFDELLASEDDEKAAVLGASLLLSLIGWLLLAEGVDEVALLLDELQVALVVI